VDAYLTLLENWTRMYIWINGPLIYKSLLGLVLTAFARKLGPVDQLIYISVCLIEVGSSCYNPMKY